MSQKMKQKIVVNGPCYKNELSIFERETNDKIEGFRRARSNWLITADDSDKTFTNVKEGKKQSNIYKGRCSCLRKMRLNTTLLRMHYKDFRPEIFWTFRRKLTEPEIENYMMQQGKVEQKEPKRRLSKTVCSSTEIWKKEDLEECLREAEKMKGRVAQKRKKKECKEKDVSGPCKKAIKRLKAAKVREGIIESCKCEDGREVTVVIKGICLCDKTSLNKVDLNKVCDEYSKMKKPEVKQIPRVEGSSGDTKEHTTETIELNTHQEDKDNLDGKTGYLHVVDSVESYRKKRREGKRQYDKDTVDEVVTNALETKKKLTFENEENLKGDGKRRPVTTAGSDLTLFRKFSSDFLMKSDTDVKSKPTAPLSSYSTPKSQLKQHSVLGIPKPVELPKTESMNNLLVNDDKKSKTKSQDKKSLVSGDRTPSEEHLANPETAHRIKSLEIYKNQQQNAPKKQEIAKKEQLTSREDIAGSKKHDKTTEKKAKVRVRNEPTVIPPKTFPAENTSRLITKSPTGPQETHDVVTYPRSWSEKIVEKKVSESKSWDSDSDRQMADLNPDNDKTSIVTLFKNNSEPKSKMGLTKEEHERMKEAEKERQKSDEKDRREKKSEITEPESS